MKLISINKLKAIIGQWYERKHLETFKFPKSISLTDLAELIESTPTVKAIPIEWIEKYIWSANTHEEKRALRKMYIAWEKENEKDN